MQILKRPSWNVAPVALVLAVMLSPFLFPPPAQADDRTCTIHVAVKQADGAGSGEVNLYRERVWDEMGVTKRDWRFVDDWHTSKGTCVIRVAPGKYKLNLARSKTYQHVQPFVLKGIGIRRAFFHLATLQVVAKDGSGASSAELHLYRERVWNDEGVTKREWRFVEDWHTSKGTCVIRVAPGNYRANLRFNKKDAKSEPFALRGYEGSRLTLDTDTGTIGVERLPSAMQPQDAVVIVWMHLSAGEVKEMARELERRRKQDAAYGRAPTKFSDKAIEALIQSTTPEADEATRRVQRAAIKFVFAPSNESAKRHMEDMCEAAKEIAK